MEIKRAYKIFTKKKEKLLMENGLFYKTSHNALWYVEEVFSFYREPARNL
jgi:hypothetical protein